MKIFKRVTIFAFVTLFAVACKNNTEPEVITVKTIAEDTKSTLDPNANYAKVEFNIKGMTCAMGCAKTIEKKMAKMDGVKSAVVDFDKELAMVEYDDAKVSPKSLKETVSKVSEIYKVEDIKTVDQFTTEKETSEHKQACKADCKMACCKDKSQEEKTKMACAEDCKKECCKAKKA
ncbi:heavy-metal-associated domain-containing protein [Winogradskyella litorisediminis]|uniref:Heavy-metal-associated domain-containing protein n=1 Tax=Winogradskyella litorisediminis TaxID=1156618 RepID=A0ABW3N8C6_9FLAO